MTVRLTKEKKESLKANCQQLLQGEQFPIRQVARTIGKIVASFPGVLHGPLYYRNLETDKIAALKYHKGNFNGLMQLSSAAKAELQWWVKNTDRAYKPISHGKHDLLITTDASNLGWGAVCNGVKTGGHWTAIEALQHINYLEMLAIFLGLKTFAREHQNIHIRAMTDNTTAVSVLNHMGTSHSDFCNTLCREIWEWCIGKNFWLSVAHIPGKQNKIADTESRRSEKESEWMLDPETLHCSLNKLQFKPDVDLFASRINKQFQNYVAYRPDPDAFAIDAFSLDWSFVKFYAFPPFSVISAVLSKIQDDQAEGICVIPNWPTQPWYPKAMQMMTSDPIHLKPDRHLLHLPSQPTEIHPLSKKLNLLVCHLSGKN